MTTAHLPSFLAATAERLQPGAAVVGEGVPWHPPFEGAGFTSCVKPTLRGGVSGKLGEGRVSRDGVGSRMTLSFAAAGQATPTNPAAIPAVGLSPARNLVSDLAGDAASALDEQWKTREMASIQPSPEPEQPFAPAPAPEQPFAPAPNSSQQIAALLAPTPTGGASEVTADPLSPVPTERFGPMLPRAANVDDALARLGAAPNRGASSAALLRDMIATLANRDSATMRALSPPPKPSNTSLTPTDLRRLASQTKMPPPLPAGARSGASSKGMPKLPAASAPPLSGKKR